MNLKQELSRPDDLDQHPLPTPAVELPVEDPLPRAKVEPALGHRHHHLAPHDLAFQVGVGIVFAGIIVPVLADGRMGSQSLQPLFIVLMQSVLVVIDEHAGRNVHRRYKGQSPLHHIPLSCH